MLARSMMVKVGAVAATGSVALALFGGSAVHTQFSATKSGTIAANGANVAVGGPSNLSCTDLVPGATPTNPWATNGGPGYCTDNFTLTNNGNANEVLSISYGAPISPTSAAIDNATDLQLLQMSYDYGAGSTTAGPFPYYTNGNPTGLFSFGTVAPGQALNVQLTLELMGQAGNDWDNATVSIPFTVTATAGTTGSLLDDIAGYTLTTPGGPNNGAFTQYNVPTNSGVDSQSTAGVGGPVSLSIENTTAYSDNGFYIPLNTTLGALKGYTVQGTGDPFGSNLWFGSYTFAPNGTLASGPAAYALGPTSTAGGPGQSLNVTDSSSFFVVQGGCNDTADANDATLAQLQAGDCSGITKSTPVTLWIGMTMPSSGSASSTITSAALAS